MFFFLLDVTVNFESSGLVVDSGTVSISHCVTEVLTALERLAQSARGELSLLFVE